MYVEQRLYTALPGKLPTWLKLYEELGMAASTRTLGPNLGFFTVEVGPLNSVLFLRGFDDIDDRARGLAARDADPDWARFRAASAEASPLLAQESKLLKPVAFSPIQSARAPFERTLPGEGMIVDHRTYDYHPGRMDAWLKAYEEIGLPVQRRLLGQLLFFGVVENGPINQVVFLWGYTSLGDRHRRRTAMMADAGWTEFRQATGGAMAPLKQQTTMVLLPTAFSPMR